MPNLTEEELRCIVNNDDLFNKYDLKNLNSVLDKGEGSKCRDCKILIVDTR